MKVIDQLMGLNYCDYCFKIHSTFNLVDWIRHEKNKKQVIRLRKEREKE